MSPDRFRMILGLLRWSGRGLAGMLDCDERLIRRWASGSQPIPPIVADWLEVLAMALSAYPPPAPDTWKQRAA